MFTFPKATFDTNDDIKAVSIVLYHRESVLLNAMFTFPIGSVGLNEDITTVSIDLYPRESVLPDAMSPCCPDFKPDPHHSATLVCGHDSSVGIINDIG